MPPLLSSKMVEYVMVSPTIRLVAEENSDNKSFIGMRSLVA